MGATIPVIYFKECNMVWINITPKIRFFFVPRGIPTVNPYCCKSVHQAYLLGMRNINVARLHY